MIMASIPPTSAVVLRLTSSLLIHGKYNTMLPMKGVFMTSTGCGYATEYKPVQQIGLTISSLEQRRDRYPYLNTQNSRVTLESATLCICLVWHHT